MRVTDRQTDGRTDRQNYDSQDRASIAASSGNQNMNQSAIFNNRHSTLNIRKCLQVNIKAQAMQPVHTGTPIVIQGLAWMLQLIHLLSLTLFINVISRKAFLRIIEPQPELGIEWVQALADISGSALCYLSNVTRAPIANPPNRAQLKGTPYHSPKLHPGPSIQ